MSYMTRQQAAVLNCIASCPGGRATAMDAGAKAAAGRPVRGPEHRVPAAGKAGVPRGRSTSCSPTEGACYQYCDKARHTDCFLLQCEGCGAIFHMDCSHLGELYEHLLEGHGFAINPRRTMFYGLCEKCREAEK